MEKQSRSYFLVLVSFSIAIVIMLFALLPEVPNKSEECIAEVKQMNYVKPEQKAIAVESAQSKPEIKVKDEKEMITVWPNSKVEKNFKYIRDIPMSEDWQEFAWNESISNGLSPYIVYAVIERESKWSVKAVSNDGHDYGLMQIRDINHKLLKDKLGVKDLLNPYDNVKAGIYMLKTTTDKNVPKALMRYNMGYSGAKKAAAKGITSTAYSRSILSIYNEMVKQYG